MPGIETAGEHRTQRVWDIIIRAERASIRKTPKFSETFREAIDDLIGVFSAEKILVVRRMARTAFAVSTSIAENGSPSDDLLVVDMNKKVHSSSSAKATLTEAFAKVLQWRRERF